MFCYRGIADITFKDKADENRFNELVSQFADNKDAAYEMLMREKSGEVISSDTPLFDRDLQLIESTLEGFKDLDDEDLNRLKGVVETQKTALIRRLNDLRGSANNLETNDRDKRKVEIDNIEILLARIEEQDDKQQFIDILEYELNNLTKYDSWLKKDGGFNVNKPTHIDTLLAIYKQLDTYAGLNVPKFALDHSQLRNKMSEIDALYKSVKDSVKTNFNEVVIGVIQEYSTKEGKNGKLTREEIVEFLRESNDIDALQKLFIDINSSSDMLLGVIAKIHADKLLIIDESKEHWTDKINEAGKKLLAAGIKDFDWITEKDTNGNKTAGIIQKVSGTFNKTLQELYNKLDDSVVDAQGKKQRREYIKKPLAQLSDDEKAHNIALSNDKAQLSQFQRAEVWDKKEGFIDGENKKYTDKFKKDRADYETYNVNERVWKQAPGVSDKAYQKYLKTYYGDEVTACRALTEKVDGEWTKTGEVEEYKTRFVKSEHTEVTDKWNSKEYETIQANPAMKEFYDFYKDTEKTILDMYPADVAKQMLNQIFRVKNDFYSKLLQKKTPIIKRVLKDIKGLFLPDIITSNRKLGEDNKPIDGIGIFYTGSLKNEERIAEIEKQIDAIKDSKDLTDKKKLKDLRNSLAIEKNKLTPDELEYDLVENLKVAMGAALHYDIMSSVESTFQIAQEVIKGKNFYETTSINNYTPKMSDGKPVVNTTTSNVEERLAGWMRMVFYNNSQVNNSKVAKLGQLLKKYTSAVGVGGLAVFPAFNNVVTAEMSNMQEGWGGRFYKNSNYLRSSKMFAKTLATGKFVKHLFKQPGQYETEKPVDLMTALIKHFNFLEENADRGTGTKAKQDLKEYFKSGNFMYALTEGGEYQAQVRSALAFLDNKMVDVKEDFEYTNFEGNKVKTEGKKISLLDAYVFDEATTKLKLRDGVIFDAKAKRDTTGAIKNMNKNIHGNHSSNDKVMIQENWYGELAFQFKRWMPNGVRNRFANRYYDESLGMEMEGRYRAVKTVLENMEGMSLQFAKESYNKLSVLEQANLKKTAAEAAMFATALALYITFDAIREGTPPDDEYTRMALNFLKQQADKSQGELTFFVSPIQWYKQTQSPIAGLRSFKEAAEFISAITGVPYYGLTGRSEKLRYEKGVNKGELKVVKEARDLLPGFKQISSFRQLDITGDFFIGR